MEKVETENRLADWAAWCYRQRDGGHGWPAYSMISKLIDCGPNAGITGKGQRSTGWEHTVPEHIRHVDDALQALGQVERDILLARHDLLRDRQGRVIRVRRNYRREPVDGVCVVSGCDCAAW